MKLQLEKERLVSVISLPLALPFYKDVLGMECELLKLPCMENYLEIQTGFGGLILVLVQGAANRKSKPVTLFTDDCLRDYHRLKRRGVNFLDNPRYIEAGLMVSFMDPCDNLYFLLEQRNYELKIVL